MLRDHYLEHYGAGLRKLAAQLEDQARAGLGQPEQLEQCQGQQPQPQLLAAQPGQHDELAALQAQLHAQRLDGKQPGGQLSDTPPSAGATVVGDLIEL